MIDIPVAWWAAKTWLKDTWDNLSGRIGERKAQVKAAWPRRPKLIVWLTMGLASVGLLLWVAPAMAGTVLYKFAITNLAVVWLYHLCVHVWPHSRPSSYLDENENVKSGMEIPYAAALIGQVLFVAIVFHGLAQLV